MKSKAVTENELKLLRYLVSYFQQGKVNPNEPKTHLPYQRVLDDLGFPNNGRTPGDSLNNHAMGGLAEWLKVNGLPAITGIIINNPNQSHYERAGLPSKSYFTFHNKHDMSFEWQQNEIKKACDLDWNNVLSAKGIQLTDDFAFADEIHEKVKEGAKRTISVNSYERSTEARNACIRIYGTKCAVCSFDFGKVYGKRGVGYIHVHHLTPISEIGEEYEIDPKKDLRPVCPNCHAMLHLGNDNITIEELKQKISINKAVHQPIFLS